MNIKNEKKVEGTGFTTLRGETSNPAPLLFHNKSKDDSVKR